jgi:Nickel responsive protein SCO4226-like
MPNFVIEREIPGAGQMTPEQVQAAAQMSLSVLRDLGPEIQWLHSYVTDNKVYCIYWAPNADIIQEHAKRCGIPANRISAVRRLMEPSSAEGSQAAQAH